jgi:hypothetical protein
VTESELNVLLKKSIEASNRTTHAVRAFVRFLFIQLSFYTAAFIVWQVGLLFPDENNCGVLGCSPHIAWIIIVGALILIGIIISSRAGWQELALSQIPQSPLYPTGSNSGSEKPIVLPRQKKKLREWLSE